MNLRVGARSFDAAGTMEEVIADEGPHTEADINRLRILRPD
jgi:hypothetical protein